MSTQTEQIQAQKRAFDSKTVVSCRHLISPEELQGLFDEIAWLRERLKAVEGVIEPRFRPEGERGTVTGPAADGTEKNV